MGFLEKCKEIAEIKRQVIGNEKQMTLNGYQDKAILTAIYKNTDLVKENEFWGEAYCALQLAAEAGEIAGKYAKLIRKGSIKENFTIGKEKEIALELGDCLWYVANLAKELGFTLEEIAIMNIEKLEDRANRGVLHGSGDQR